MRERQRRERRNNNRLTLSLYDHKVNYLEETQTRIAVPDLPKSFARGAGGPDTRAHPDGRQDLSRETRHRDLVVAAPGRARGRFAAHGLCTLCDGRRSRGGILRLAEAAAWFAKAPAAA